MAVNPKSLANLTDKIKSSEEAREKQKKSVEARRRNNILKNAAKRVITDDIAEDMINSVASRVVHSGDPNAVKALWEILGERIDKTELEIGANTLSVATAMTSEEKKQALEEMLGKLC